MGQAVDYYFFYGPELNRVVSDYLIVYTGAAPLFPKWAYGYWQCRERYHGCREILDTAAEFRKRKIPVDVLVQDWLYWGKYDWNAMKFDEQHYPQTKGDVINSTLATCQMSISVWSKLGKDRTFTSVWQRRNFSSRATPGWISSTRRPEQPSGRNSKMESLKKVWTAGGWTRPSRSTTRSRVGRIFLGDGESLRNAYPLYVTQAMYEGQRATTDRKRVVILTRSAFAGQQRYGAASWSGDISANWITLQRQIPAGLSFSMSGIPYWTTDVGGFFRPKDQYTSEAYHELLVRWFEYGASAANLSRSWIPV